MYVRLVVHTVNGLTFTWYKQQQHLILYRLTSQYVYLQGSTVQNELAGCFHTVKPDLALPLTPLNIPPSSHVQVSTTSSDVAESIQRVPQPLTQNTSCHFHAQESYNSFVPNRTLVSLYTTRGSATYSPEHSNHK